VQHFSVRPSSRFAPSSFLVVAPDGRVVKTVPVDVDPREALREAHDLAERMSRLNLQRITPAA